MDHDQVALFLSSCTTPGFRRSLGTMPQDALERAGFQAGEIALLIASLNKSRAQKGGSGEYTRVSQAFQRIQIDNKLFSKKSFLDDWSG